MGQYRYFERDSYEGKQYVTSGVTRFSLKAMKHLPKVGKVLYVRGYTSRSRDNISRTFVLVRGENGTIRFGGFLWGYGGEGPRGLAELFKVLGIAPELATQRLALGPSPDLQTPGDHWKISFTKEGKYIVQWEADTIAGVQLSISKPQLAA